MILAPNSHHYWMFWNGLVYSSNPKAAEALASTAMQQADWDRV